MAVVLSRYEVGEDVRPPIPLDRRRRLLKTIVKQHRLPGRPCIVSVHKQGDAYVATDESVVLRKEWKRRHVGATDVIVITYLPLGGGGSSSSGSKGGGKAIGAAVAMLALAIVVPWAVGAVAGAAGLGGVLGTTAGLTLAGQVLAYGIIAGASYFLSKATKPKANKEDTRPVYGVSGGGNLPRTGDRIPVTYGRAWIQPDLSQAPYFTYETTEPDFTGLPDTDQVLYQRMTVGAGKYHFHTLKIGDAIAWDEVNGAHAPFNHMQLEIITPGTQSVLVPGSVYSSENVGGIDLGYANDGNPTHGPYPVTPPGVKTTKIQLDYSWPQGHYQSSPKRTGKLPVTWGIVFEWAPCDDDGNPTGPFTQLWQDTGFSVATRAVRTTKMVDVPEGQYLVQARNYMQSIDPSLEAQGVSMVSQVSWDGLRGWLYDEPLRPDVQEIALKVSAKAMGSTLSFSNVWVEVTKILPVYDGSGWVEQPTRKAIWAFADIIRNPTYGGGVGDDKVDINTLVHYANTVTQFDTFDGLIRGPVSVYEAAGTVLGVIRAEPVVLGDTWTLVRDEPRQFTKHVISRRQIVAGSSSVEYDLDMSNGDADVWVEYSINGDPNKRGEWRETVGAQTDSPKRMQLFGVSSHDHAVHLARWYANVAYWRREARLFSTEMTGKIFMRNDPALVDVWFLRAAQAAGIDHGDAGALTLTFDKDVTVNVNDHIVIRDRHGLEWGPVAITTSLGARTIQLYAPDVSAVQSFTGITLATLLAEKPNRAMPISVLIGQVSELSRGYIVRTARPDSSSRMQVQAVYDAPQVWDALGETTPAGPPIGSQPTDDTIKRPILPWLSAKIVQKATALLLEWSLGRSQEAVEYQVWMRYAERDTWEYISEGKAIEGSYPVDFSTSFNNFDVTVRARCVNALGVPSDYIFQTVSLFAPAINSETAALDVAIENLSQQLKYEISLLSKQADGVLAQADTSIADLRKRIDDLTQQLALADATTAGEEWDQRQLIKVALDGNYSAIQTETTLRVSHDQALADQITALQANLDNGQSTAIQNLTTRVTTDEGKIDANASAITALDSRLTGNVQANANAISQLDTRVTSVEHTVTSQADAITTLQSEINNPSSGTSATATAIQDLQTRVTNDEGKIDANASAITSVSTTVNGHTASISTIQSSVNGLNLSFGIVGTIDNVSGGLIITGARRNDGAVAFNARFSGDFFVDATITARHLVTQTAVITTSLQVAGGTVGNGHLQANSATQVAAQAADLNGGGAFYIYMTTRGSGGVVIEGYLTGGGGGSPGYGQIWVYMDGNLIDVWNPFYAATGVYSQGGGDNSNLTLQTAPVPTSRVQLVYPAAGAHTFEFYSPYGYSGTVYAIVSELSK